jgi:hypothetical protein
VCVGGGVLDTQVLRSYLSPGRWDGTTVPQHINATTWSRMTLAGGPFESIHTNGGEAQVCGRLPATPTINMSVRHMQTYWNQHIVIQHIAAHYRTQHVTL